ncbi:MAG: GNAT family N-acetyltransferase [Saccharofermentanales bacterium]
MKNLETKRLILRPWRESDFEAAHTYASELENVRFMPFGPNTESETKDFITRSINNNAADPQTNYVYAITLKESGAVIGGCEISKYGESEAALGWILHRDYWKQGLGTELADALIKFGFEELNLHRIYATCDAENYGSYRVMERNNMRREGHFIKKNFRRGEWRDEFVYAILKEEWEVHKQ